MGHPDCRQGGDLLKAGCLTCYLVALRAVLASIIVAAFFVSMNFCGGSMVSISGGGGIGPKNLFSRIYKIHSYLGRIVGSNFGGGKRTEVQPRAEKILFSRIPGLNFWGGSDRNAVSWYPSFFRHTAFSRSVLLGCKRDHVF